MSQITLEALGLTKDEIAERVVARIADDLMRTYAHDPDGEEYERPTRFAETLQKAVLAKVDEAVERIAAKNVLPNVASYVEGLCLQETNKWGERTGAKMTFIEYLVKRAEVYLTEPVNHQGKTKSEDSYSWSASQTRIAYLVHQHLQYSIETAMKAALQNANSAIVNGLEKTIKLKLDEVRQALKIEVKTR